MMSLMVSRKSTSHTLLQIAAIVLASAAVARLTAMYLAIWAPCRWMFS